jgi:hypothetical protein
LFRPGGTALVGLSSHRNQWSTSPRAQVASKVCPQCLQTRAPAAMSSAHIGQGVRAVGAGGRMNSASRGCVGCMPPPAPSSSARQYADKCSESRRTRSSSLAEASSARCRTARTATAFASRRAWLAARHPSRNACRPLPLSSAWRAFSIVLVALTSLRPFGHDDPLGPWLQSTAWWCRSGPLPAGRGADVVCPPSTIQLSESYLNEIPRRTR